MPSGPPSPPGPLPPPASFTLTSIGIIHTPFADRLSAPRQPAEAAEVEGVIELYPGKNLEHALDDLADWTHLWVIFVFDRNEGWRPKVLPPRSGGKRRGVLATRAPYRPNPIGLSVVKLLGVEGLRVRVQGVDMLDGSPVLDLKPYVPYTDSIGEAGSGWLGRTADPGPRYEVAWSPRAEAQRAFLRERGVDVGGAIEAALAVSPHPHPYRRIRVEADGARTLALKEWRARFTLDGDRVTIEALSSGYRPAQRLAPGLEVHRAFAVVFGEGLGDRGG